MNMKDRFSSIAKNINNRAAQIAKKLEELVMISKINMSIESNENKMYEIYAEIGEIVSSRYKEQKDIPQEVKGLCEDINQLEAYNEKLIGKIKKIKKIKKCSNCGMDMKQEINYCSKCGIKQTN